MSLCTERIVLKRNRKNSLVNFDKLFCKVVNQKLTSLKHIFFRLNFHGDELYPLGGAELGAKLGAQAISHLEEVEFKGTERVN